MWTFVRVFRTETSCDLLENRHFGSWHHQCCLRIVHKTSLYISGVALLFAALMARVRATMERQIPLGYQDEAGFHEGEKKGPGEDIWPPFW
jgi:hypothetical protein